MTATCHQLGYERYVELVEAEGRRFLEALADADISTRVPSCPEWNVAELADHIGGIHRWAGRHVELLSQQRLRGREIPHNAPESDDTRPGWLADGAALLVDALRRADPGAPVWGWGSDNHVRFWARRMLHETTIHRADLELAIDRPPDIAPEVSVDGIDEFLDNLPHAVYFAPAVNALRGEGQRLLFVAADVGVHWTIGLAPDGFEWRHSDEQGDVRIEAPAADLLLFVYGRKDPAGVVWSGNEKILELWRQNAAI
ncbi:MAG: maleylpyruvate isomerase family mycothiol-dependent enzyme [Actinomycetota bacterium]|nr:maleylpyruvate isomerase family mycothiol-dependent enzyme [Actinomycetota bacterium]